MLPGPRFRGDDEWFGNQACQTPWPAPELPEVAGIQRDVDGGVVAKGGEAQAMRAARFKPHTENGEPVEMLVLTPIQYELGR